MTENFITFVLDETGSMMSIKDDTIGGFNQFLAEMKKPGPEGTPDILTRFTLVKFDSNHQTVVHKGVAISQVPDLTPETYSPGASTPLIEACVKAIRATEKAISGEGESEQRVQIVIQTDGQENASGAEYTNEVLNKLIKEKTEAGWLFIFLGAGQDAFAQAAKFGIAPGRALNYARAESKSAFAAASRTSSEYARTGQTEDFTDAERASAAGSPTPDNQADGTKDDLVEDMDFST